MREPAILPAIPDVSPAPASRGLRAHVVDTLSAAILAGRYRPGARLNEGRIAREPHISRIPVREALSRLQEQGLVQDRERRGMFVTDPGPEEVQQIGALRAVRILWRLRVARSSGVP